MAGLRGSLCAQAPLSAGPEELEDPLMQAGGHLKRVLIAGTCNAHQAPMAAAIATVRKLQSKAHDVYGHVDRLGRMMEDGLPEALRGVSGPANAKN